MSSQRSVRAMALSAAAVFAVGLPLFAMAAAHSEGFLCRGDGAAYFMMARSLVVDHDTDLTDEYRELDARLPPGSLVMMAVRLSAREVPGSDRIYLPWPIGTGLLMSPFYALGYGVELAVARLSGRAADSYGAIPQIAFGLGSLVYGLLGFWASFFTWRRLAGPGAAAWSAAALALGGPLLYYVFLHPSMSHAVSFGLLACFVLLWWRHWSHAAAGWPWLLWLLFGLLVLVRYQNVVFVLLPLSLLVREPLRRSRRLLLGTAGVGALASFAPLSLQLAELARTGQLDAAAGGAATAAGGGVILGGNELSLGSPHFWDVLFSCLHGAFYWTPVLALGVAGLLWAARQASWARVLAVVFFADVYLIGCLARGSNWAGDNAFGMRYLGDSAALLAPGMALLLARAGSARAGRLLARAGLSLLIAGNALLALAFALRTIPHDQCVTYPRMAAGIAGAITTLAAPAAHPRAVPLGRPAVPPVPPP
jgi:hypothetical protein